MPGLVGKGVLQGLHVSGLVSMLQGIGINISYGCRRHALACHVAGTLDGFICKFEGLFAIHVPGPVLQLRHYPGSVFIGKSGSIRLSEPVAHASHLLWLIRKSPGMLIGISIPVLHPLNSLYDGLFWGSLGYAFVYLVLHRLGGQSFLLRLLDHILDALGIFMSELMLVHCLQISRIILVYLLLCPIM